MTNDVAANGGTLMTFGDESLKLARANFYERKLCRNEESIQRNERNDRSPFAEKNARRIPVSGNRFSQRSRRKK